MVYSLAFLITGMSFVVLATLLLVRGWRNWQTRLFAVAVSLHALWALGESLGLGMIAPKISLILHTVHILGWPVFLVSLLPQDRGGFPYIVYSAAPILILAKTVLIFSHALNPALAGQFIFITDILTIVLALAAVVSVFQAASEYERWALKFICIPLGALYAYDLFLYAQLLAIPTPRMEYFQIRGLLNLATVPFLFIAASRHKFWREKFMISRQAVLYSVTLIGAGLYLLMVTFATILIPKITKESALPLQVGLMFGAALVLLFLLTSGSARAKIKLFMARHFYARKYDYAHEWRRLMATLSEEERASPLENRIIRACAEVLEVPGGALWIIDQGRPQIQATWNYRVQRQMTENFQSQVFFDTHKQPRCLYDDTLAQSTFSADASAWVVIPLVHGHDLFGFISLSKPRARHHIDREDEELILLVARQCTSFLAESKAVAALEQNRQFARFNRQYAFVAHDIKNIISQLSVMLSNYDRHAANPEFQRDMHETIRNTVERMQKLIDRLSRLGEGGGSADEPQEIDPYAVLVEDLSTKGRADGKKPLLSSSPDARDCRIRVPTERFTETVGHLLSNAFEASGADGSVSVYLDKIGPYVVVDIIDEGEGMSADFIRDKLFAPFKSTKTTGFGVGAFQCREFAREQGGDLEVISSPGSGTTMRLLFPVLSQSYSKVMSSP